MRELRATDKIRKKSPQANNNQITVEQISKKQPSVDTTKTLTEDLNVQQVYKTDGKESIYKSLDTDTSFLASGGPSSFKVTSRTKKRKSFLTADGKNHLLTKIYFKAEQSPRKNVQLSLHNMEEVFDQCRVKIMEDLEQKILDKNERMRSQEEAVRLEQEY